MAAWSAPSLVVGDRRSGQAFETNQGCSDCLHARAISKSEFNFIEIESDGAGELWTYIGNSWVV
jgi:hypothetical protein